MFVADAQCMCDRSYEEDDAEDDKAEDTGYGQHRTRDLLKFSSGCYPIEDVPRSEITTRNTQQSFVLFTQVEPPNKTLPRSVHARVQVCSQFKREHQGTLKFHLNFHH